MRDRLIIILPEWLPRVLIPDPSIVWLLALILGLTFSIRDAKRCGLNPKIMALVGFWGILGGHCGGHLFDLLQTPKAIIDDPIILLQFLTGGKGIFGALLGGGLFGGLYLYWKKTSILAYADSAAPAIAIGYAIARIGCFLNGCCFGTASELPWSVRFPVKTMAFFEHWSKGWLRSDDVLSLPVHPAQFYHAAAGLILFLVLKNWKGRWIGSHVAIGLASYGFLRFFLQFFRGDRRPVLGFLDINQILGLVFVLIAGLLWWRLGKIQAASSNVMPTLPSADVMQPERL